MRGAIVTWIRSIPIPQLIFAGVWFFICGLWNSSLQIFVDHVSFFHQFHAAKYKQGVQPEALPDLGFALCPEIPRERLADDICSAILGISLASTLFHSERWKILQRFSLLEGSLFILRGCTISITLLPNPFKACQVQAEIDESLIYQGLRVMAGQRVTCGDVLFSGHTAIMVLCCLFWFHYMPSGVPPRISRVIKWIIFIATFCGVSACVCTKFHYSVDVTVGVILASCLFTLYHLVIQMPKFVEKKTPFWRFICWYEGHIHTVYELSSNTNKAISQMEKANLIGSASLFDGEGGTGSPRSPENVSIEHDSHWSWSRRN